jgi:hypothetical protein
MFYYFKAIDFKDNIDSTALESMVLEYTSQDSPAIPDLSFGTTVQDYQIISIPMTLANNNVNEIFREIMPYDIKKWRLFHYNNGITGEYPGTFSTLVAGKAYWLIVRDEAVIHVGGGAMSRIENDDGFAITLQPGWNQVGNPFNFDISWIDVLDFNASQDSVGMIKTYEDGLLTEVDNVPPFRGGFVFVSGDQSVFVNIPPNPGFRSSRIAGDLLLAGKNPIDQADWRVRLAASFGQYTNNLNTLGMHPESESGFDKNDEPLLPVPHEISGFDLYFTHAGEKYDKLSRDVVRSKDFQTWEMELKKYGGSGNIELKWDNTYFGNNEFNLIMVDETNDRMIDMRATDSYTFFATNVHKFKIYYGTEEKLSREIMPSNMQVGDIYPNPFEDELNIPLSLPDTGTDYEIKVSLSDLKGNQIQQLSSNHLNAGYHLIRCDLSGTDQYVAGFYIVRIVITSTKHKEILYRKVLKL